MSESAPEAPHNDAPDDQAPTETPADEQPQPEAEVDWKAKSQAQQKVNRDLERKLKDARAKADETEQLRAELAKLQGREAEYAEQQKAREAEAAALAKANERILKAEVRVAAAGKLADPADALRFLDLSALEVGADGDVDADQIAAAVEDLIQSKPYLAAQSGKRFQGTADSGARNGSTRPTQLTEADVDRLYAEGKYAEIAAARADGRLDDYFTSS